MRDSSTCGRRACTALVLALVVAFCGGCPFAPPSDNSNDNGTGGSYPFVDGDDNFTLPGATALSLDGISERKFSGEITTNDDIDIFNLGVLDPGDGLYVDVQATSGNLDAVAIVFNDQEETQAFNDDRTPDASNLNPLLDFVIRGASGVYYLGISALDGTNSRGAYRVIVRVTRALGVPAPQAQIVYLDWVGGEGIVVDNVGVYNITPFSAADVGLSAGATASLKDRVQQIVAERYAEFNLILLNSDDDPVPPQPHTTIYFGGTSAQAFAISEQIDTYNEDPSDNAIVFTRSYQRAFVGRPNQEELAQALGNTVAHEIGHLLGLVHTQDCDELMDTTCGNNRILAPQELGKAQLDSSVFGLGYQDAVELIGWVLGFIGL